MTEEEKEQHELPMKQYIAKYLKDSTFRTGTLEPDLTREEAIGMMYFYYVIDGRNGPGTWNPSVAAKARKMYFEQALHDA